jgi:hypothetical protein
LAPQNIRKIEFSQRVVTKCCQEAKMEGREKKKTRLMSLTKESQWRIEKERVEN